jgi:acyl transferase domain-containing protein
VYCESHSPAVEELREELVGGLVGIEPVSCGVPFFSTATGGFLDTALLDGEYWYRSLRERVRFEEATRALAPHTNAFIEISTHPVLGGAIGQTLEDAGLEERVGVLGSLRRDEGGLDRFVYSLAEAWVLGAPVDWGVFFAGSEAKRVELPRYAFQRERYWLTPTASAGDAAGMGLGAAGHPLLGAAVRVAGGESWLFTGRLSLDRHPWLADHAVLDRALLPATAFLELVLAAGRVVGCEGVAELTLQAPLVLTPEGAVQLQVALGEPDGDGRREVQVYSRPQLPAQAAGEQEDGDGGWTRHASATLPARADTARSLGDRGLERLGSDWPPAGAREIDVELLYDRLAETGFNYGPQFQGLQAAWRTDSGEIYAEVTLTEQAAAEAGKYAIHPALLDAALHVGLPEWGEELQASGAILPFALGAVSVYREGASSLQVCLTRGEDGTRMTAYEETGEPVLSIDSLAFRPVDPSVLLGAGSVAAVGGRGASPRLQSRRRLSGGGSLVRRLAGIPEHEWQGVVLEVVCIQAAAVLGHDSHAAIDPPRSLKEQGLDSRGAVELRTRLAGGTGLGVPRDADLRSSELRGDRRVPAGAGGRCCPRCGCNAHGSGRSRRGARRADRDCWDGLPISGVGVHCAGAVGVARGGPGRDLGFPAGSRLGPRSDLRPGSRSRGDELHA